MGSLLPGWDERLPGQPPKEFQDIQEEEEEQQQAAGGYFAALAQLKRLHAEGGEPSSPIPIARRSASLTRRSLPCAARGHTSSHGGAVEPPPSPLAARRSYTGHGGALSPPLLGGGGRVLARAETMQDGGRRTHGGGSAAGNDAHRPGVLQRMYSLPMTRGEQRDVLDDLLPLSPTSAASGSSLDAYKTRTPDKHAPDYQWWRRLESAALNDHPDESRSSAREKGFIPQFGATGQGLHFHMDTQGQQEQRA